VVLVVAGAHVIWATHLGDVDAHMVVERGEEVLGSAAECEYGGGHKLFDYVEGVFDRLAVSAMAVLVLPSA
jgi:hypothetical protein